MKPGRTIRIAIAAGMLAAAGTNPVHAGDAGGGCGSDPTKSETAWVGDAKCHFQFRGLPLTVFGSATANGAANVRVWISAVQNGPAILLECAKSGTSSTSCKAGYPDSTTFIDYAQLQTIWCHVEGRSTGQYRCQSGSGR